MSDSAQTGQSEGLGSAWQRLLSSGDAMFRSRLELAGIELAEERQRLLWLLLLGLLTMLFGLLALVSLTALLVVLLWDVVGPWQTLAVLFLLYAGVTGYCVFRLRAAVENAPVPFSATRAEFEKDGAAWRARS